MDNVNSVCAKVGMSRQNYYARRRRRERRRVDNDLVAEAHNVSPAPIPATPAIRRPETGGDSSILLEVTQELEALAPSSDRQFLKSGTFALQAHDPGSRIYYRNIYVRPSDDDQFPIVRPPQWIRPMTRSMCSRPR